MKFLDKMGNALELLLALGFVTAMVICPAISEPVYVTGCSGTYIGAGYVLTAGHCLGQDELFVAKDNPANDKDDVVTEKFTVKVIWTAGDRDLGLVRMDKVLVKTSKEEREEGKEHFKGVTIPAIPFTATKVSCADLKIGDKLFVKGWPGGEYVEYAATVASPAKHHWKWAVSYLAVSPGFFGSSGSGMLNEKNEVTGVLVGGIMGSGILAFVPASEICAILPKDLP
jgi:V8-like Glu-specific endopeptidase